MKRLLVACLLSLSCFYVVAAQENSAAGANKRTSFNGVWIPQDEKEKKPDAAPDEWTNIIIEQKGKEIKFTLVYPPGADPPKKELTFFTNNRGETNNGMVNFSAVARRQPSQEEKQPDEKIKSKTKWDGDALVIVHQVVFHDGAATLNMNVIMRWEISSDGKTLTRTIKGGITSATYRENNKNKTIEVKGNAPLDVKDTYILLEKK
jgi:hypothetical protein